MLEMTHSQKISKAKLKETQVFLMLEALGTLCYINRSGDTYDVIINFNIAANFRTRRSAKNYLIRTLKDEVNKLILF